MTTLIEIAASLAMNPQMVEAGANLINNLLGKPCEVASGMIADQIYSWRWKNRIRIATRASQILEENEIAAKVLPAGFLVPLLDAAGDIEDDTLQEMWASLLVSGIKSERHQHPAFFSILKSLSSDEAKIVNEIWTAMLSSGGIILPMLKMSKSMNLNDRPIGPLIDWQSVFDSKEHFQDLYEVTRLPIYFLNLERLDLLDGAQNERVLLSQWGTEFATACFLKPPSP